MKQIIIDNTKFDFNIGCRLLKLKYNDSPFAELDGIWNDIEPLSFAEISKISNIEERRIAMKCFGIDRLVSEVKPRLIDSKTIAKKTTWVNQDGELEEMNFDDTYELYEVSGSKLSMGIENKWQTLDDAYYVKCKDTSTERDYLIWVDLKSVYRNSFDDAYMYRFSEEKDKISAIDAIAWTIQTNIPIGKIDRIVRQGDCILLKPKGKFEYLSSPRHLKSDEYLSLLVAES